MSTEDNNQNIENSNNASAADTVEFDAVGVGENSTYGADENKAVESQPKHQAKTQAEIKASSDSEPDANTEEDTNSEDNQEPTEKVIDFTEEGEAAEKRKDGKKKGFSVIKFLLIIAAVFFLCLAVFGIWNRWFRYDDAKDLISNWQVSGTNAVVNIDGKQIHLDKNTIFNYEVDSGAKLLYLKTGEYTGTCHYRFSWDRCQIAFIDSGEKNAIATTWADLCWFSDFITCKMSGIGLSPAYTKESGQDVDTTDTGLDDLIANGHTETILLDKISTKKTSETE